MEPKNRKILAPSPSATAGITVGGSVAVIVVWALDTQVLSEPLPGFIATAVGSLVTAAVTYVAQLLEALLNRVRRE